MPAVSPTRVSSHNISAEDLDKHALDVIDKLNDAGFDAYLVGGCVRDALCGVKPKDFDVATNAKPEEVRSLFRRSRLVGRRFPIAHVRYGRNLIEVSTFRQGQHDSLETNAQGLIVKDHAFGTMADDAFRRDFSINALYYDVSSNEIIDYVGGIADVEAKRLRFIGDPQERLAEDPVRLLRAMRFAAKLDFTIDPNILDHAEDTAERLEEIPRARLFDEFLKLFLTGHAAQVWLGIKDTPLVRSLFPSCNPDSPLVLDAMRNTDDRIAQDMPVTPGFLIAVLLWDDFQARVQEHNPEAKPGPMYDLAMDTFAVQQQHISLPRRFTMFARETWQLQTRLESRQPRHIGRTISHKRFRAAYDFLVLRGAYDSQLESTAQWWLAFQDADQEHRKQMIDALPKGGGKRKRRRKKSSGPPANQFGSDYNSGFNK
ncbi:MAG: polynucleotide adenylyltransferase PcnB [Pseudomonadota bacterium]